MKPKSIVSTVLLVFVATSVVYLVVNESRSRPGANEGGPAQMPTAGSDAESVGIAGNGKAAEHKLIAYYFHGNVRCKTCLTIEEYAREVLVDAFPTAMASGELEWRSVNIDEPGNGHFALEYEVTTSSLVLVEMENGKETEWRKLDEVWDLVGDKPTFQAYVEGEALVYLEDGS